MTNFQTSLEIVVDTFVILEKDKVDTEKKLVDMFTTSTETMRMIFESVKKIDSVKSSVHNIEKLLAASHKNAKVLNDSVRAHQDDLVLSSSAKILSVLENISTSVNEISVNTKAQLDKNEATIDTINESLQNINSKVAENKKSKNTGIFEKITDNKLVKQITQGVGLIVLIAAAIAAIGVALGVMKPVDPITVLTVGITISLLVESFRRVYATLEDVKMKDVFMFAGLITFIGLGVVAASVILNYVQPLDQMRVLPTVIAISIMAIGMAYVIRSIGDVNVIEALLLPLILPVMALAIVSASSILEEATFSGQTQNKVTQLSMASIGIGILGISAAFILRAAKFKMGDIKDAYLSLVLLPIMAGAIVATAYALKKYGAIPEFTIVDTARLVMIAIGVGVVALAAAFILRAAKFEGKNIKEAALAQAILPLFGAAMVATAQIIKEGMPEFTQDDAKGIIMATIGIGIMSLAMGWIIGKVLKDVDIKTAAKSMAVVGIISAGIVAASHILKTGAFENAPPLQQTITAMASIGIASLLVRFVLGAIPLSMAIKGTAAMIVVAGGVVAVAHIFQYLPKSMGPVKQFFMDMVDIFTYAVDGLGMILAKFINSVAPALTYVADFIKVVITAVAEGLSLVIGSVANGLSQIISTVSQADPVAMLAFGLALGGLFVELGVIAAMSTLLLPGAAAMIMMAGAVGILVEAANKDIDAERFSNDLAILGTGMSNFANILPGFFTGASAAVTAAGLASAISMIVDAASKPFDANRLVTGLGVLAPALNKFAKELSADSSGKVETVKIGNSEVPKHLLLLGIASEAARIVKDVQMDENKANQFIGGMKALAKGIIAFTKEMTDPKNQPGDMEMASGQLGAYPKVLIPLGIATEAAKLVNQVSMDEKKAKQFTDGMTKLAEGIGNFTKSIELIKPNIEMSEGQFSDTPKVMVPIRIALEAAKLIQTASMDTTKADNFTNGMSKLAEGLKNYSDNIQKISINEDKLKSIKNVYDSIEYGSKRVAKVTEMKLDMQKYMNNLGYGVIKYTNAINEVKLAADFDNKVNKIYESMRNFSRISSDAEDVFKFANAITQLGNSLVKLSDSLTKLSAPLKDKKFVEALQATSIGLLTISLIDSQNFEKVTNKFSENQNKIVNMIAKVDAKVKEVNKSSQMPSDKVKEQEAKSKELLQSYDNKQTQIKQPNTQQPTQPVVKKQEAEVKNNYDSITGGKTINDVVSAIEDLRKDLKGNGKIFNK